ncbi:MULTISPECIES: hypothetical protein [Paracoccaceae]|jgi:hypothetical protein|uniref:Mobilization protein n=1 Tax=Fuscovulum blasticum TaxID=1075 RepID=Q8GI71_FUSBL|nr:hypothetical protein [Fuscovulum blasticum]BAC54123.1 mobilization protein [Fuscovulum blasticum]CAQ58481.1 MobS protein [Expression vector pIND4]
MAGPTVDFAVMVRFITTPATPTAQRPAPRTPAQQEAAAELKAARTAEAARRLDTRRKVVLGGALLALAERDAAAAAMLARLKQMLTRPADRKLFADLPDG